MEPSVFAHKDHLKAGNMCLNRFCIDEDAAFEIFGLNYFQKSTKKNILKGIFEANKGEIDQEIIDSCLLKISQCEANERKTHFVYAGDRYHLIHEDKLRSFILKAMKKNKIQSVIVTSFYMWRNKLVTKEKTESFFNGKEKEKNSVTDDLDLLFEFFCLGQEVDDELYTYFFPKLTEEDLNLVEIRDQSYFQTFLWSNGADVEEREMKRSKSDSKFAHGWVYRKTFTLEDKSP